MREAIYGRRAVRELTTEPVEERALRGLIDAAVQAPSAVNRQPWLFTVVSDRELVARISNGAKTHMLITFQAALASHHFLHIPGCSDYRRASEVSSSRGLEKTSGDRSDYVEAVGFPGADTT